ncbi:MAG TPA: hypothetical protein VGC09_21130, partial [Rhodopila sp.]
MLKPRKLASWFGSRRNAPPQSQAGAPEATTPPAVAGSPPALRASQAAPPHPSFEQRPPAPLTVLPHRAALTVLPRRAPPAVLPHRAPPAVLPHRARITALPWQAPGAAPASGTTRLSPTTNAPPVRHSTGMTTLQERSNVMSRTFRGGPRLHITVLTALLTLLSACQTRPETAYDVAQPRTAPVRNIGNFNEALRCMDDMFLVQGKKDIYITTAGIPDATGLIAAGTKEMFITAVSRMSAKSDAFRFVDYDPTQLDVQVLSELVGLHDDFVAPNYYVRGAITQLDSNVLQSQASAGVSIPYMDLAINGNQVVSVVSLDLNVGKLVTRQILPGISASNSMAVVQSGKGADVGGLIGKAGLSLSVSLDKSEGFHQAVRNLIELSTIEVLGKLTHVPYWQCLRIDSTNPNFRAEARGWFDIMGGGERDRFVSAALVRAGYLRGGADQDAGLADAVSRYQADSGLVPNGRIDFDLYYRLLSNETRQPKVASNSLSS